MNALVVDEASVGAHALEHADEAHPLGRGVKAQHLEGRVGVNRAEHGEEGRLRGVAGHEPVASALGPSRSKRHLAPLSRRPCSSTATPAARSMSSVVARVRTASSTVVTPSADESGEQHRRLHLRACHRHAGS